MDWTLLKAQKKVLIELQASKKIKGGSSEWATLEGIINLIDSLQDTAVDVYGYDRELVFNLSGDDEKPKMSSKEARKIVLEKDK
jgi:hypothetical protein